MMKHISYVGLTVIVAFMAIGLRTSAFAERKPINAIMAGDDTDVAAASIGRYQISAFVDNGHGCYVVDTATGELWKVYKSRPSHVSGPLVK